MSIGPVGGNLRGASTATRKLFLPVNRAMGFQDTAWYPAKTTTLPLRFLTTLPDLAPGSDVKVRPIWSTASITTTQTATWRVRQFQATFGSTALGNVTLVAASSAAEASAAVATANAVQKGSAATFYPGVISNEKLVMFAVDASAVSGLTLGEDHANNVCLYGIEIEYAPQSFLGS